MTQRCSCTAGLGRRADLQNRVTVLWIFQQRFQELLCVFIFSTNMNIYYKLYNSAIFYGEIKCDARLSTFRVVDKPTHICKDLNGNPERKICFINNHGFGWNIPLLTPLSLIPPTIDNAIFAVYSHFASKTGLLTPSVDDAFRRFSAPSFVDDGFALSMARGMFCKGYSSMPRIVVLAIRGHNSMGTTPSSSNPAIAAPHPKPRNGLPPQQQRFWRFNVEMLDKRKMNLRMDCFPVPRQKKFATLMPNQMVLMFSGQG